MNEHFVLDASALLCVLMRERGADRLRSVLSSCCISAVNFGEIVSKLTEQGTPPETVRVAPRAFDLNAIPLDRDLAEAAGLMRAATRSAGLSLGDRCCLALAKRLGAAAVTADRAWSRVDVGIEVECVR